MVKPNLNLSGLVIFVILGTAGGAFAEKQLIDDDTGSTVEQYFPRKQVKAAQVKPVRKAVEPSDEAKEESADGSEEVRQPYKEADDGLQLRQISTLLLNGASPLDLAEVRAFKLLNFKPSMFYQEPGLCRTPLLAIRAGIVSGPRGPSEVLILQFWGIASLTIVREPLANLQKTCFIPA